jgi:3-oxoacyl-[acyl-carrier protein] reductase
MTGLRALVTGAAGGIGGAIADRLEASGHAVVRTDLAGAGQIVLADVTIPADVDRLCDAAESELGGVDVLVNAAGIYGERTSFTASDPEVWWRVLETNLRGPALLCRRLVPSMVDRGAGWIVNVNSKAAVWNDPGQSSVAYSTSKAALARFTEALAGEVRGTGVTVVDLSPGMVRTGMLASRPDHDAIPDGWFLPADVVAGKVVQLLDGGYEDLHGHFVHATDDLDQLRSRVRADPALRTLSLGPYGPDDPIA